MATTDLELIQYLRARLDVGLRALEGQFKHLLLRAQVPGCSECVVAGGLCFCLCRTRHCRVCLGSIYAGLCSVLCFPDLGQRKDGRFAVCGVPRFIGVTSTHPPLRSWRRHSGAQRVQGAML